MDYYNRVVQMDIRIITSEYLVETIKPKMIKTVQTWDGRQARKVYRLPFRTVPSRRAIYDRTRNTIICHPAFVEYIRYIIEKSKG